MGFSCRSADPELHDRSQVSISAVLKRKYPKTRSAYALRVFLRLLDRCWDTKKIDVWRLVYLLRQAKKIPQSASCGIVRSKNCLLLVWFCREVQCRHFFSGFLWGITTT